MHRWSVYRLLRVCSLLLVGVLAWSSAHAPIQPAFDYPLKKPVPPQVSERASSSSSRVKAHADPLPHSARSSSAMASAADVSPLRPSVRIQVPFMSQAPHGNWQMPYQEACEEASLILVHHFLRGTPITADEMDAEILDLVRVEDQTFHFPPDITMEQLARVAQEHYGYTVQLFTSFTVEDMKRLLAQGHPIIVPLAGRRLGNPYYSGEGPWYHALVLTGYDETGFITNDVGTRRGEGYRYPFQQLYQSIHNWNNVKEDIENGRRVMLVVTLPSSA